MGYSKKFWDVPLWPEKGWKFTKNDLKMPIYRGKTQKFFNLFFSLENDQMLDPWQNLLKITFFVGKRCGGVCICPKGLISTKIFALAHTVLEIFAKNHFQKNDVFRKFSDFSLPLIADFCKFSFKFFNFFCNFFNFFSCSFSKF